MCFINLLDLHNIRLCTISKQYFYQMIQFENLQSKLIRDVIEIILF